MGRRMNQTPEDPQGPYTAAVFGPRGYGPTDASIHPPTLRTGRQPPLTGRHPPRTGRHTTGRRAITLTPRERAHPGAGPEWIRFRRVALLVVATVGGPRPSPWVATTTGQEG